MIGRFGQAICQSVAHQTPKRHGPRRETWVTIMQFIFFITLFIMSFVLYSFGPLQRDLHGQIIYIQAILQPPIAASFWSLATSRKRHTGYFRDRRRSKHYHLRRTARLRPIERPFRNPVRQFSRPSTWLWHRRMPLVARYGFSR